MNDRKVNQYNQQEKKKEGLANKVKKVKKKEKKNFLICVFLQVYIYICIILCNKWFRMGDPYYYLIGLFCWVWTKICKSEENFDDEIVIK